MKRLLIAGVFIVFLAMAMSPLCRGITYTDAQRETISIVGGYMVYHYIIPGALNYDLNTTLPWAIGDFHQNFTAIVWHYTGDVNLTDGFWNERGYGAGAYHAGQNITETLYNSIHQGGGNDANPSDTWSHLNWTMDSTAWTADVYYYLTNTTVINNQVTYTETDNNDPNVGGLWSVTDSVEFGTLPFNMTLYLTIDYPDSVVSDSPDTTPWDSQIVTTGTIKTVDYQKFGPAHDLSTSDVTGGTNSVTAEFTSDDKLKDAIWNIDITDEAWDGKFAGITSPVTVTVNDDALDATDVELTGNTIALTGLSIPNDDNTVVFTWTTGGTGGTGGTTPGPTTTPVGPGLNWDTEVANGVPAWAAVAIGIVVVFTIIAVASIEKK